MDQATFRRLIIGTAAAALLVLGAYITTFALQYGWSVSSDQAVWGQFGDYLGGVLNPIFGFLAFVGVLWTLHLQATQLSLLKHQAELEEIQRLLASISSEADTLLSHKPRRVDEKIENEYLTVFDMIAGIGTAFLNGSPAAEEIKKRALPSIQFSIAALAIQLHQFVWVLKEYAKAGGSPTISQFYKRRYEVVICWLDTSGLLGPNERLREFFEPAQLAPVLRAQNEV